MNHGRISSTCNMVKDFLYHIKNIEETSKYFHHKDESLDLVI